MKFFEWLNTRVSIAVWVMGLLALLVTIVEMYKNWQTLKELGKGIKKLFLKVWNWHKTVRRRKYNKVVSSSEYLEWQKQILKNIYDPLVKSYKDDSICDYANAFGFEFEALYFKSKEIQYPFDEIKYKEKLGEFPLEVKETKLGKLKVQYGKQNKLAKRYYRLLKPTISFPNNIGYMLDKIDTDGINFGFSAHPNTYLSNVYSSNVLEYELYLLHIKLYKKKYKNRNKIEKTDGKSYYKRGTIYLGSDSKEFLLSLLPIRSSIHKKFGSNEKNILLEGNGRESLLGVQAMVLCKNHKCGYDILRIRRSEHVDAKSGFLQFVPSGGFSALNNDISHDIITSNFSITKAILREFLEECFGEEDFSGRKTVSTEQVYSNSVIEKLDLLKNTQTIEFIGSAFSLVSLRHELCFIIKIDNFDIINSIRNNEECANVIDFISLEKLENIKTWQYTFAKKNYFDYKKLNPTSASLWNLAKETELYNQCRLSAEQTLSTIES